LDQIKQNIRTISTLYYVLAGITAVFSLIPLIHVTIGIVALSGGMTPDIQPPGGAEGMENIEPFPDKIFGGIFLGVGLFFIILGEAFAFIFFLTARKMSRFSSYKFCMIGSGISCAFAPLGTALGIFSLINLNKPEARELFQG